MDEDDFLWSCAFVNATKDRKYIVPDGFDLEPLNSEPFQSSTNRIRRSLLNNDKDKCLSVRIVEERGEGVIDIIGGELWEAALLLCSMIIRDPKSYLKYHSIVELGSGVGLPTLLLGHLSLLEPYRSDEHVVLRELIATDNDTLLLSNLLASVRSQLDCQPPSCSELPPIDITVASLDWTSSPSVAVAKGSLVMGSALCYADCHATALHALIVHYLKVEEVAKVMIVQIADREGFQTLISLLRADGLTCTVEPIDEEIVRYCHSIRRTAHQADGRKVSVDYFFSLPFNAAVEDDGRLGLLRTDPSVFCCLSIT